MGYPISQQYTWMMCYPRWCANQEPNQNQQYTRMMHYRFSNIPGRAFECRYSPKRSTTHALPPGVVPPPWPHLSDANLPGPHHQTPLLAKYALLGGKKERCEPFLPSVELGAAESVPMRRVGGVQRLCGGGG
jgi:hypothetical protein